MSTPDYMPEPETQEAKAAARRLRLRSTGPGSVFDAIKHRGGPNAAYYDAAAVLAFEREHPRHGGNREQLIRSTFNCTATRFQQRLYHLIHDDEQNARSIDAQTVNRLLRLEAESIRRREQRAEGLAP